MRPLRSLAFALACALPIPTALAQAPCADARALLDALSIPKGGDRLMFVGGYGAFFPEDAHYDGSARMGKDFRCHLVIDRAGQEVGRWPMLVQPASKVFQRFQPFGASPVLQVTGPGTFTMSVEFNGEDVASVPFEIAAQASGDPFDPATTYSIDADLCDWAQLVVRHGGSQESISASFRLRGLDLAAHAGKDMEVTVERQGRVVYAGGSIGRTALGDGVNWQTFNKQLRYPDQKGGGFLPASEFTKVDGTYRLVVRCEGRAVRAWEFTVQGNTIQPHARSSFDHAPRTDYLLSRAVLPENEGYESLFWLEPLADPAAAPEAIPASAPVSAAARALWKPTVAAPARAPRVVVTDIAARVDAHIAAGDGVVAYGTGPNTGVAYVMCGDDVERSIPAGAEFSSKAFFFAGKKLVLVRKNEVCVFDTESGLLTELPADQVWLSRSPYAALKGRHIVFDGNLVAVLCDPKKTSDRRVAKVIDLSGAEPRIIGLGFPDATPSELVSIAVDAEGGRLVLASARKDCLFHAPLAEDAQFAKVGLSGHDSIDRSCAPIVRRGVAATFDATGSRKLRLVDLDAGTVRTLCGMGKSLRYFDFDGDRVALASDVSHGSSYEVRVGDASGQPAAPAGAGESAKYGKAGYAQRVALYGSDLVFASGSGAGGIGKDEVLLGTDGKAWHEVERGGAPLPAVDVTLGQHVLAFKTGKSRDARIGYVLLGKGMGPAGLSVCGD